MIDTAAAWAHLDALAKPQRSLGRLEPLAVQLAMVQQSLSPRTRPRRIVLFAGDHGVVARGVSAWPQAVTGLMVETIRTSRATSSALAAAHGCDLRLVDVGVANPPASPHPPFYHHASIASGTADLATGPAMTLAQFDTAWAVGANEAWRAQADGHAVLIAGEMGIGNTTPAACLTALLTGADPACVVGHGAGADDAAMAAKVGIVAAATARSAALIGSDPRAAIASVAGFEIVAMALSESCCQK
jgi:nicotinate-nucleotide--dimethylbenzimidazole phosphoribosyltransferase